MDRNISEDPLELEEFDSVEDAELEPVSEPDISALDLPCIQYPGFKLEKQHLERRSAIPLPGVPPGER
jgi:hypothetical protein